jgi:hypothetical protein
MNREQLEDYLKSLTNEELESKMKLAKTENELAAAGRDDEKHYKCYSAFVILLSEKMTRKFVEYFNEKNKI